MIGGCDIYPAVSAHDGHRDAVDERRAAGGVRRKG